MSVNNEKSVREGSSVFEHLASLPPGAEPERIMVIVLEALRELIDYELAVVLGYDGRDTLTVHTAVGPLSGPRFSRYSLSLSLRPDLAALLAEGKPRLFAAEEMHIDTYEEILEMPDGHSCLVAPLTVSGRTIGLLTLDHRRCGVFSRQILNFISVITRLIAVSLLQSERSRELAVRNARLIEERNRLLSHEAETFRNLAGGSPAWTEVIDLIKLVAAADSPVLLLGETGTGKEEAARAVHRLSSRSAGPFVALNCSALPASIAESELFGHEKGSFTGAAALRRGRFELADGGTLFLDEIGDLPPEIQPKLLRALQEGSFERVGGELPVRVDVRIIAATHRDLAAAVGAGTFREDLFYRISVFPIRLPPLRERGNDVVTIAELFLSRLRERPHWGRLGFSADAVETLLERRWPGNVRELKNAVERAAILARGELITARELAQLDWSRAAEGLPESGLSRSDTPGRGTAGTTGRGPQVGDGTPSVRLTAGGNAARAGTLAEFERGYIAEVLESCGGKIYGPDGAAAALGLKPTTLQSRLRKLGLR